MNKSTLVECPVCGRMVAFVKGATNTAGELVMVRHWRADVLRWDWCSGSNLSVTAARRNQAVRQ